MCLAVMSIGLYSSVIPFLSLMSFFVCLQKVDDIRKKAVDFSHDAVCQRSDLEIQLLCLV